MVTMAKVILGFVIVLVVTAVIVGITVGVQYRRHCDNPAAPTDLTVSSSGNDTLITWSEPPRHALCTITYRLLYQVEGDEPIDRRITDLFLRIPRIAPCITMELTLWSIAQTGEQSSNFIRDNYTGIPPEINSPSGLQFTVISEGFRVSWEKPAELATCDGVQYNVTVTSDLNDNTMEFLADTEDFTILDEWYCFSFTVVIATVFNDITSYPPSRYHVPNPQVLNNVVALVSPDDPDLLMITWQSHHKEILCSLQYEVIYNSEGEDQQSVTVATPPALFNFTYCAVANFSVSTSVGWVSTRFHGPATQNPSRVDAVSDLIISEGVGGRVVTWTGLSPIGVCSLTYNIVLGTDLGTTSYITTEARFEVPGDIQCSSILAIVQAVMGGTHGEFATSPVYNCDALTPQIRSKNPSERME